MFGLAAASVRSWGRERGPRGPRPRAAAPLLAALWMLAGAGCNCGESAGPATSGAEQAGSDGTGSTATIEGVIRLVQGAELPQYETHPMLPESPTRPAIPEHCTPPQQSDRQPVGLAGEDRRLTGVLVALHEFSTSPRREPVTHELVIRDCRLEPSLIVATRGDRLRLVNETDYPFLPDLGTGLMQALMHGQDRELELAQGGVRTLTCGFAASCGRAEVVTLYHPLHAVSGEGGRFRIEGVPANDELQISAWHPLFEESRQTLTLQPGETRELELVLSPASAPEAPAEAPAAAPAEEEHAEGDPDLF